MGAPQRSGLLKEVLPAAVGVAEVFEDTADVTLYPEEEVSVARATRNRRREFATGRQCARAAMAKLGVAPTAIAKGARGAPRWPRGLVGSITHCAGYRAAAVARAGDLITVGIDAEPNEPLPARVLGRISSPRERVMLHDLADAAPGVAWDRLLFSAKESVYKAWTPLTGSFLGFDGAEVAIDPGAGGFVVRLLAPGASTVGDARSELYGRYAVRDGLVVTAIARRRSPGTAPSALCARNLSLPYVRPE